LQCFRRKVARIKPNRMPPTKRLKIRALVIAGSEIPVFRHLGNIRKMQIKIQCGKYEIYSSRKVSERSERALRKTSIRAHY
tara:strand:- start:1112 stop:1354 length:243 start_codon:yes stop_codon:yes gene_type:complete